MCGVVLGHDDQASRVFIDAMHDARTRHAANAGKAVSAMREQGVHQRASHRSWRGMHRHPRGLIDDDEVFVFVNDVDRDRLWHGRRRLGRGQRERILRAGARFVLRVRDGGAVGRESTRADQTLHPRPREIRPEFGEPSIHTVAGIGGRHRRADFAIFNFLFAFGHCGTELGVAVLGVILISADCARLGHGRWLAIAVRERESFAQDGVTMRPILTLFLGAAAAIALSLGAFVLANSSPLGHARDIDAHLPGPASPAGDVLDVLVWNLGYGGLGAGSDFVADGGRHYLPPSRAAVRENVDAITALLAREGPGTDVFVFQEIARGGLVNYWVDLRQHVDDVLAGRRRLFFADFRTRLMPWPLRMEHGQAIYSSSEIAEYDLVALPAEDTSIFGVKRRYAALVSRLPIANRTGGWTVVSVHLAAFDPDAAVRTRQLHELMAWAQAEHARGQHVILAGDWNFQIADTEFPHMTEDRFLFWLFPFPQEELPQGWRIAADAAVPSVRTNHQTYVAGDNYVTTIDGFIVSPNVEVESVAGIDLGFEHTDHQPVRLRARAR